MESEAVNWTLRPSAGMNCVLLIVVL